MFGFIDFVSDQTPHNFINHFYNLQYFTVYKTLKCHVNQENVQKVKLILASWPNS